MISARRLLLGAVVASLACRDERLITLPAAASLAVSPESATVLLGDSVLLQSVARDANGRGFIGIPTAWSASNPAVASVSVSGVVLGVGLGRDTITATSSGLTARATVSVVPRPAIQLSRDSVGFVATAGGPSPTPDTVYVTNSGGGSLAGLTLGTIAFGPGPTGWLAAALSRTTAPDTLVLTAQTGSLLAGTYSATVPVTATNATNSPRALKVTFTLN